MDELTIGDFVILPGEQRKIELPVAKLYTDANVSLPVHIIRAKKAGPTIFISAAVHGDELNGIEIIRRLINQKKLKITKGTVIAVPMVNVYGVVNQSRYMPDRRDLNRCFPGSAKGSLAGRVAHIFLNEIDKIFLYINCGNQSNFLENQIYFFQFYLILNRNNSYWRRPNLTKI